MRIQITRHDSGEFNIKSDCPGPFTTLTVLKQVIAVIEKAALEGEIEAAKNSVAIPSAEQTRELVGV